MDCIVIRGTLPFLVDDQHCLGLDAKNVIHSFVCLSSSPTPSQLRCSGPVNDLFGAICSTLLQQHRSFAFLSHFFSIWRNRSEVFWFAAEPVSITFKLCLERHRKNAKKENRKEMHRRRTEKQACWSSPLSKYQRAMFSYPYRNAPRSLFETLKETFIDWCLPHLRSSFGPVWKADKTFVFVSECRCTTAGNQSTCQYP